jgi:flagellar basal-body rod protein FlgB
MIDDKMFPLIEGMLSLTAKRQQALSSNIANIDTPGYKARDYIFQQELSGLAMDATADQHIDTAEPGSPTRMIQMDAPSKGNGNSVDLEQNMMELTKNALQYITLVQYLNQRMRTLRTSIQEGGRV